MNFIKNMKISRAIILVALTPIIVALIFAVQIISKDSEIVDEFDKLEVLTNLSINISHLVHEQQKERGATAVFLGSKGTKFKSELSTQRENTNKKREEFRDFANSFNHNDYSKTFNKNFDNLLHELKKMDNIRSSTDSLSISASEAIGYYTSLNTLNLDLIAYIARTSPDPEMVIKIISYVNFLQGKERAGIERAVGANNFSAGKFSQIGRAHV